MKTKIYQLSLLSSLVFSVIDNVSEANVTPFIGVRGGVANMEMEISGDIPHDTLEDTVSVIGINGGLGINNSVIGARFEVAADFYGEFKDNYEFSYMGHHFSEELSFKTTTIMSNLYLDLYPCSVFNIYGMGGVGSSLLRDAKVGDEEDDHDSSFAWNAGAGIRINPIENFSIDASWRYASIYNKDDAEIRSNNIFLGAVYNF